MTKYLKTINHFLVDKGEFWDIVFAPFLKLISLFIFTQEADS